MLTARSTAAYKVGLMSLSNVCPPLTQRNGTLRGRSTDAARPNKQEDKPVGGRLQWPFSVAVRSLAKSSAVPEAATVHSDESRLGRFVT